MRMQPTVPGLLIAVGLMMSAPALAATQAGKLTLRGSLGLTTLSMGDVNDQIRAERDAFLADTLLEEATWNPIGSAPNLSLELDAQLTPVVSMGLGYSLQRGSRRNEAFKTISTDPLTGEPQEFEIFDHEPSFSAWDVVGTLGLWVPSAPGFHFGAQLGLIRGTFKKQTAHVFSTFSGEFTEFTQGEWTGTGVVLGAFTGYEQQLSSAVSLSTRLGYRYRKINSPEGILRVTNLDESEGTSYEWELGPMLDAAGNEMDLDLGGYYFNLMLSLGLGGGD